LFYLISALLMPLRELKHAVILGARPKTRTALFQFGMAAAILAAIWGTGRLLGILLIRPGVETDATMWTVQTGETAAILRTVTIAGTLGLLALVLLSVQLLCYVAARPRRRPASLPASASGRRTAILLLGAMFFGPATLQGAEGKNEDVQALMRRADAAYAAEDFAEAGRLYQAVLDIDAMSSRAVFQKARLTPKGSAEQIRMFKRYVELETSDPWGYMALGDALAAAGNLAGAAAEYERALRLAPKEADARAGLARILIRSGRIDEAVALHEKLAEENSQDPKAWRELGQSRLRAGRNSGAAAALERSLALQEDAETRDMLQRSRLRKSPSFTPFAGRSSDSDNNTVERFGLKGDWQAGDRLRLGFSAGRTRVEDDLSSALAQEFGLTADWQPHRKFRLNSLAGIARTRDSAAGAARRTTGVFDLRARWSSSADGLSGEARGVRLPILATPRLAAQPVVLEEVRARVDAPVYGPLRFRVLGRTGAVDAKEERNTRTGYGGGVVFRLSPSIEWSTLYQRLSYARPSAAGYFAPRMVETVETGIYLEREMETAPLSLAFDAGGGGQRAAQHGLAAGPWGRTYHLWGLVGWNIRRNLLLGVELEASESLLALNAFTSSNSWRYVSAMLSLRWAVLP
jgi:tetratricopeptide (TPR) repeat protein